MRLLSVAALLAITGCGSSQTCSSACESLSACASATVCERTCTNPQVDGCGGYGQLCSPEYPGAPDFSVCLNSCEPLPSSQQNDFAQCVSAASGCTNQLSCQM